MRAYFDQRGWPEAAGDRSEWVAELHRLKTDRFMRLIEGGQLPLRPGIRRLVDEALAAGVRLAVCSTSNERAVTAIVNGSSYTSPSESVVRTRMEYEDSVPKSNTSADLS